MIFALHLERKIQDIKAQVLNIIFYNFITPYWIF